MFSAVRSSVHNLGQKKKFIKLPGQFIKASHVGIRGFRQPSATAKQ